MIEPATPEEARTTLPRRAAERGYSLAELSRLLNRNLRYLQQYIERDTLRALHEKHRMCLAQLLMIDEQELGMRNQWMPLH